MNKKAISFVEIIISISIIVLLASIWLSYKASYDDNKFNLKVKSDLATLNNSFLAYKQENSTLPIAKSNDNFFKADSSYAHNASDDAFWVYGYVTSDLIPKKYLAYLPLDPRTNQFYAYWKTLDPKNLQFEFAWVTTKDNKSSTIVTWDYSWENTVWLIREYNWPQFLYDKTDSHFPYNPTERLMTAKIGSYSGTVTINWQSNNILNQTLVAWDKIKVWNSWFANIYYSDGSRSTLEKNSKLVLTKMQYPSDSNSNLITKIKLTLNNWTIWTKATKLNPAWSEFEITTQDATAAVRWTIFKVQKDTWSDTIVEVEKWKVDVINNQNSTQKEQAIPWKQITAMANAIMTKSITAVVSAKDPGTTIVNFSNINPKITKIKIENGKIKMLVKPEVITKNWTYIKDKDRIEVWSCTNTWCIINNTTTTKIKFCEKIWANGEENCTKLIDITKQSRDKLEESQLKNIVDENDDNKEECDFKVDWKCIKNNLWNNWKVVAYAGYNKAYGNGCATCWQGGKKENFEKNYWLLDKEWKYFWTATWTLYLYQNFAKEDNWTDIKCNTEDWNSKWSWENIPFSPYTDTNFSKLTYWWDNNYTCWHDLYNLNGTKWVLVSFWDNWRYLKYSNLDLWNNFAIEMSVRGSDLNRSSWIYNLFNTDNDAFLQIKGSNHCSWLNPDDFYKVISKIKGTDIETTVLNKDWNDVSSNCTFLSGASNWSNNTLYVWSGDLKNNQWNWIIDYVKIYTKED